MATAMLMIMTMIVKEEETEIITRACGDETIVPSEPKNERRLPFTVGSLRSTGMMIYGKSSSWRWNEEFVRPNVSYCFPS